MKKFLTLKLTESPDWVSARCPEFGIGTFAETSIEAKTRIYDNVKAMSYVVVEKKKNGFEIDEKLFRFAYIINNNGANVSQYFNEISE